MSIFKIALPGNDVKDASISQEVLDSQFPSPKVNTLAQPPHAGIIHLNWSSSVAVPLGTTKLIYSFPHGYDYIPSCFASYSFDNGSVRNSGVLPFQYGAIGVILLDADIRNINLKYFSADLAGVTVVPPFLMQVRFYVFAERGHE